MAVHDNVNFYVWMKINRAIDWDSDWIGFWLPDTDHPFDDPNGVDLAMFSKHGYGDCWMDFTTGNLINDADSGGVNDVYGTLVVDEVSNTTFIEFKKPLNSGDNAGHDIITEPGSSVFLMILISYHSSDSTPNYIEIEMPQNAPPAFYLHPFVFKLQGVTPTETTSETTEESTTNPGTNTFKIGYTFLDLIFISMMIALPITIRAIRKMKK